MIEVTQKYSLIWISQASMSGPYYDRAWELTRNAAKDTSVFFVGRSFALQGPANDLPAHMWIIENGEFSMPSDPSAKMKLPDVMIFDQMIKRYGELKFPVYDRIVRSFNMRSEL